MKKLLIYIITFTLSTSAFSQTAVNLANDLAPKGNVVYIAPGINPQTVFDATAAGSLIRFLPGLHSWGINSNAAILYCNKAMSIELMGGATLKLANNSTAVSTVGEITSNQGTVAKTLDDFSIGATSNYTGIVAVNYYVEIVLGGGGSTNTFKWGVFTEAGVYNQVATDVAITGAEQTLQNGAKIKFTATTGHSAGSLWYVSYDGGESYGIRVGTGTHNTYIEDVNIFGEGVIDLNLPNNPQPSLLVANISSCVLFNGRVRKCSVSDITMKNGHRTVMAYGENTGTYQLGGGVTGSGTEYVCEYIDILRTKQLNDYNEECNGVLLGHPSHRGALRFVRCNYNYIKTGQTAIEPNFLLSDYQVIGNLLDGGPKPVSIHCWRKSTNGLITNNRTINNPTTPDVVVIAAPAGWETAQNITVSNNVVSPPVQPYIYSSDVLGLKLPTVYYKAGSSAFAALPGENYQQATNGQSIMVWGDQSGYRQQALPYSFADRPTFKSSNTSITAAANRYLSYTPKTANPVALTIVAKVQVPDITTAITTNIFWAHRSESTRLIQLAIVSSNVSFQIRGSGNSIQTITKAATANNTYMKIIAEFNKAGNLHKLYVDNLTSPGTNTTNFSSESFDSTIGSLFGYWIAAPTRGFTGDIQTFAVYEKLFNDTEKQEILDAL